MSSMAVGAIVFGCTFSGAMLGMFLRAVLPAHHMTSESKDVVKLGTGLIATLSAMVLGLLIASAKSSFDAQRTGFQQLSANLVLLDHVLARYGPETKETRDGLRKVVASIIERLWPNEAAESPGSGVQPPAGSASALSGTGITASGNVLFEQVRSLSPKTEGQRALQSQALQIASDLGRTRWLLVEEQESALPTPFLVVVVFWLSVLFLSFGLFAPPNPTVIVTLLVCALSVAGAMFLIVDLDDPFGGFIQISSYSLQNALSQMNR
jgi:hypothetical protein